MRRRNRSARPVPRRPNAAPVNVWKASAATKPVTRPASPARTPAPRGPACRRTRAAIPASAARPNRPRPAGPPVSATVPARASASAATPGSCARKRRARGSCARPRRPVAATAPARVRRRHLARRSGAHPTARPAARRARRTRTAWRPTAASTRSCGKKPIGATCGNNDECNSSICAQGRCCSAACTGTCKSCAVPGSEGTCRNVPDGQDLHGHCADGGAATCGLDGQCDGLGACRKYAVNTVCGMDSCSTGAERVAGRCDAAGTCAPGMLRSCSPYVCGATQLFDQVHDHRRLRDRLQLRRQRLRAEGATARPARPRSECKSGYCEQGVCCNDACSATCKSCNIAGLGRDLLAESPTGPRRRPPRSAPTWGDHLVRDRRQVQRRRAPAAATPRTRTAAPPSCTGSTLSSPRSATALGVVPARDHQLVRAVHSAAPPPAGRPVRPRRPTAPRATRAST